MKKTFLPIVLLCFMQGIAICQSFPLWGKLVPGKYAVGYRDTLLVNKTSSYKYGTYDGGKPFLVSIWYPAVQNRAKSLMHFGDYMDFRRFTDHKNIIDSLRKKYEEIYVRDGLAKNIKDMKPTTVELGDDRKKLQDGLHNLTVNATRNLTQQQGTFPCIYYHHGAQSSTFDNVAFCEYMASQGYVVISSNYLWPRENEASLGHADQVNDISFVVSATRPLIDSKTPYLIGAGHSWGAQALILADTLDEKPFKKIIAFHTTLEDKPVDMAFKRWSILMEAFQKKHIKMTTPTVLFAPEFRIKDGFHFLPFKENKTTPYTFITVKTKYLTHDGFVTLGNLRSPFAPEYKMDDETELKTQLDYYASIVVLARYLIEHDQYDLKDIPLSERFSIDKHN